MITYEPDRSCYPTNRVGELKKHTTGYADNYLTLTLYPSQEADTLHISSKIIFVLTMQPPAPG